MRSCPSCSHPMQVLLLQKVEVDWCRACRGLWFDRGELAAALGIDGVPMMTREQIAGWCPRCQEGLGPPRSKREGHALWFSRIDGSDVLACIDCGGSFVSEGVLKRRGAVPATGLEAKFVCAGCGDGYPVASAQETQAGLVCPRCRPLPTPVPERASPLEEALASVVGLLRRAVE